MFGWQRLERLIEAAPFRAASETIRIVHRHLYALVGCAHQSDDIKTPAVRRKGKMD